MKYAVTKRNMDAMDVIFALGELGKFAKDGKFQGAREDEVAPIEELSS